MADQQIHDGSNNDSHSKLEAEQIEQREYAPPLGKRHKAKRHCARFWWLHILIFCIVFLIIALCLVYVAMPRIAQKGVNESTLEVTEFKFLNPTPNSVELTQGVIIHSPSMYTPTLDPFNASSYLVTNGTFGPTPIIYVEMPTIHALHPQSSAEVVGQTVNINDLGQLTEYASQLIGAENVTTALTGRTKLHEGALPVITIDYNSSSTYLGLNGLKGFNVTGVKINLTALTGPNLSGFAYIPNPSVITVDMGNVTLNLSTAKAGVVGTSMISNMTIVPGNNSLPLIGTLNQTLILSSMDANGLVDLEIQATSVVNTAGQHLTYYEQALGANILSLSMNVKQIIEDSLTL